MESYTKVGSKSTISDCFLKQRNFPLFFCNCFYF